MFGIQDQGDARRSRPSTSQAPPSVCEGRGEGDEGFLGRREADRRDGLLEKGIRREEGVRDLYPHADRLFAFIRERHAIWERRNKGLPKPWTEDPILQSYRFCNVYRELDKETIWIRKNWRNDSDPDNWFAMVVARLVNWSPTLEVVGYPVPWRPSTFLRRIHALEDKGVKVWGGAYIVSTNGAKQPKAEYLTEQVLTPLWNARKEIRPRPDDTLEAFYDRLRRFRGMGSFIAAQVVAAAKFVAPLTQAPDWESFAASGLGSR